MFEKDLSVVILRPDALKMQPVSAVDKSTEWQAAITIIPLL